MSFHLLGAFDFIHRGIEGVERKCSAYDFKSLLCLVMISWNEKRAFHMDFL